MGDPEKEGAQNIRWKLSSKSLDSAYSVEIPW